MFGHVSDETSNRGAIGHDVIAHDTRTAFGCINQSEQQFDERTFAGAICANKSRYPCIELNCEIVERYDGAVALG